MSGGGHGSGNQGGQLGSGQADHASIVGRDGGLEDAGADAIDFEERNGELTGGEGVAEDLRGDLDGLVLRDGCGAGQFLRNLGEHVSDGQGSVCGC